MNKKMSNLLYLLSEDARITTKKLGQHLAVSQQNASYLVKQAQKKGIITEYKTIIDPAKFGYINIIVFYHFRTYDEFDDMISSMVKNPHIISIERVSLGADLYVEFCVPNLSFFNKLNRSLLTKYKHVIKVAHIFVVIVKHLWKRNYLVEKADSTDSIVSGDREVIWLNKREKSVLQSIIKNPRQSILSIADHAHTDARTALKIKKSLENQGIIVKYSIVMNHEKVQVNRNFLLIKLGYDDPLIMDKLVRFTQRNKNVIETIKVIGNSEVILVIERTTKLIDMMVDIRKRFDIREYTLIKSLNIIKSTSIPATF